MKLDKSESQDNIDPKTNTPPSKPETPAIAETETITNIPALIILLIITLFFPPVGVFFVAGCSPDLLFNILFTILGYFPGHIHAFYLIWVYYDRKDQRERGIPIKEETFGIFSQRVKYGGPAWISEL